MREQSLEEAWAALARVFAWDAEPLASQRREIAVVRAYGLAVLEECRPYSSTKYPEAYDAIRQRIERLGQP